MERIRKGQEDRALNTIRQLRGLVDAVEQFVLSGSAEVESAHNAAYCATRLVGDVARLYQMQRDEQQRSGAEGGE